jgi:dienelactone hydrolase
MSEFWFGDGMKTRYSTILALLATALFSSALQTTPGSLVAADASGCDAPDSAQAKQEQRRETQTDKKTGAPVTAIAATIEPTLVEFPGPDRSGLLHGFIYVPIGGRGRFPAIIWNHGSERLPGDRQELAGFYTDHGYVFFIPHRHGQGRSSNVPGYHVDEQQKCGSGSDRPKCAVKLHELYNKDVVAAVAWLKQQPYVDPRRIVMSGVSFGGIQTMLSAEKGLGIRAFVPFAPAAMSWGNTELQHRLLEAATKATAPMFLIQAEGDYSTGPYEKVGGYLQRKGGLNGAKLYAKFGSTAQEAHGTFSTRSEGIKLWGADVLRFFDRAMKEGQKTGDRRPEAGVRSREFDVSDSEVRF